MKTEFGVVLLLQGGYVDLCNGIWRVQGSLAVTRAIGDAHLKQWVIAEPETREIRIEPRHEFLILASDGLWETVSDSNPSVITDYKQNKQILIH